jgi:hypothetical protein
MDGVLDLISLYSYCRQHGYAYSLLFKSIRRIVGFTGLFSNDALIIAIVYCLYGWGILMCLRYTMVEFVNLFIEFGIACVHLFLDYWR